MKRIISTILLAIIFIHTSSAQTISTEGYTNKKIKEEFNYESSNIFKTITTIDNYFIIDNGDYLLSRNNKDNEYAIIAENSSVTDFILKTNIRIGPSSNKKASVGIILKAQQDGKGAIIVEVNKKGHYRIKQLNLNKYNIISGNRLNNGWIKNQNINKLEKENTIEIRSEKNIYELYINDNYITTFFITDYTSGSCGLIINSGTKARISYYYVNTKEKSINTNAFNTNNINKDDNKLIEELNKEINILKENNSKLNQINAELLNIRNTEKENKTEQLALKEDIKNKENEIVILNTNITKLTTQLDNSLKITENFKSENIQLENKIQTTNLEAETKLKEKEKTIIDKNNELELLKSNMQDINIKLDEVNLKLEVNKKALAETEKNKKEIIKENGIILKKSETEIEILNKEKINLENINSKANTKIKKLNKDIEILNKEKINLENINLKANTKIKKLNKDIELIQQQIISEKNLNSKIKKELKNTINTHSKEKNKLNKNIQELKSSIDALQKEKEGLVNKLSSEKIKYNAVNKEKKKANAKAKELSNKLSQSNNALANAKNKNKKQTSLINELENNNNNLNAVIENQSTELNELKKEVKDLESKNKNLKELFILRDFEVNGVKPSQLIKKINYPDSKKLKDNKTYSVQIGVYMSVQPNTTLKGLKDVWYETTEKGAYVYFSGRFTSPLEATEHKIKLVQLGYVNAFIVTLPNK
tara:strand:- start:599 stop:2731 length:2133 start_codon:yes stop_codon:yes gene_type:complete